MRYLLLAAALVALGASFAYLAAPTGRRIRPTRGARRCCIAAAACFAGAWEVGACYLLPGTALMLTLAVAVAGLTLYPFLGVWLELRRPPRHLPR